MTTQALITSVDARHGRRVFLRNDDGSVDVIRICDEHGDVSLPVPAPHDPGDCPTCLERAGRLRYSALLRERPELF